MSFDILNRWTSAIVFHSERAQTIAEAAAEAIRNRADLRSANLRGANLNGADLSGANLRSADLRSANLRGANLSGANLYGANLRSADLRSADLSGANLNGAEVSSANLYGADLRSADLSGANLNGADLSGANLRSADLRSANLRGANLNGADLSGANLYGADLRSADLRGADLRGADLRSADLRSADLYGAAGVNKFLTSPLYMLLDQPGKIRSYKLVTKEGTGPCYPGFEYAVGRRVECVADQDESLACSFGINVASLDWCIREWRAGYRILVVEHEAKDIAAIPIASDGKYRVHRCDVVAEKDLSQLGLIPKPEQQHPDTKEAVCS